MESISHAPPLGYDFDDRRGLIKLNRPSVSVGSGQGILGSTLEANYTTEQNYTLKITLSAAEDLDAGLAAPAPAPAPATAPSGAGGVRLLDPATGTDAANRDGVVFLLNRLQVVPLDLPATGGLIPNAAVMPMSGGNYVVVSYSAADNFIQVRVGADPFNATLQAQFSVSGGAFTGDGMSFPFTAL